ncbi:MAG TPA: sigma-E factor negative regulatory protein [Rhodocyclaceae bacterium]
MKTKLSALMDGEVAEHEAQVLWAALREDEELRRRWLDYQVIGDALKGEGRLDRELAGRVMQALEAEPTVLAPRPAPASRVAWRRQAMALAASLAGVAVVGWLALGSGHAPQPEIVAQQVPAATSQAAAVPVSETIAASPVRQASPDMQEYLIAHEAQSSLLEFRGGAEHIRTVAAVGMAPAK